MGTVKPEETVDWLVRVGRNLWETTRPLYYRVAGVEVEVTTRFRTDIYTLVSNTDHPELWRSAILHDFIIESKIFRRAVADVLFLQDMVAAAFAIYTRLQTEGVSEKDARGEMLGIVRLAIRRYCGVALWRRARELFTGD